MYTIIISEVVYLIKTWLQLQSWGVIPRKLVTLATAMSIQLFPDTQYIILSQCCLLEHKNSGISTSLAGNVARKYIHVPLNFTDIIISLNIYPI